MITDVDIREMKKIFATKEDLKAYATKEDLKRTENYLKYEINVVKDELREFKREFNIFKDSVLKTLNWLVGAFKKFNDEYTVLSHQSIRITKQLDDHEIRIVSLEKKPAFQ